MTNELTGLEVLISEYKTLSSELEMLEERKNHIREQILQATNNDEYEGYGLTIARQSPEPTLDWKRAISFLNIPQEQLLPFYKERPSYFRFTLKRQISK